MSGINAAQFLLDCLDVLCADLILGKFQSRIWNILIWRYIKEVYQKNSGCFDTQI